MNEFTYEQKKQMLLALDATTFEDAWNEMYLGGFDGEGWRESLWDAVCKKYGVTRQELDYVNAIFNAADEFDMFSEVRRTYIQSAQTVVNMRQTASDAMDALVVRWMWPLYAEKANAAMDVELPDLGGTV